LVYLKSEITTMPNVTKAPTQVIVHARVKARLLLVEQSIGCDSNYSRLPIWRNLFPDTLCGFKPVLVAIG
jgi:hypothetical protein